MLQTINTHMKIIQIAMEVQTGRSYWTIWQIYIKVGKWKLSLSNSTHVSDLWGDFKLLWIARPVPNFITFFNFPIMQNSYKCRILLKLSLLHIRNNVCYWCVKVWAISTAIDKCLGDFSGSARCNFTKLTPNLWWLFQCISRCCRLV